ncbi:hypothetical protein MMG00_12025 [Ignatzschineria rhizosphaerae]|uniref:Uncharacterized protein n=1 Tax=Ignatzschineria rhizosphaerae TaxID=2923279 RepID=A0ABY3X378_9GAMM|nr:hypothetical protein [Ignatzschineria rhizosphaerae]UNM95912.1 hypothetical protein MMG00_12025 [Ignatzschineria rhizosphaerae]
MSKQLKQQYMESIHSFNDLGKAALAKINQVMDENPMLKNSIFEGALYDLQQGIDGVEYHHEQLEKLLQEEKPFLVNEKTVITLKQA